MTDSVTKGNQQKDKLTQSELGSQIKEKTSKGKNFNAIKQTVSKFKSRIRFKFWAKFNIFRKKLTLPQDQQAPKLFKFTLN